MAGNAAVPSASGQRAKGPRVFNCPHCGGSILLRAQGFSVTAVCRSCGAIVDTANENYKVISRVMAKMRREPVIPLGQRGRLRGATWEVIGYMERSDGTGLYPWSEYLLFNPAKGYRWLMEFDGHWTYLLTARDKPARRVQARPGVTYLGRDFHLFHRGTAKVNYVIGEFYWRVKAGDVVEVEDYVNPPEVLSLESTKDEIVWSIGEYVEPDAILAAFGLDKSLPLRVGVAPNQPSSLKARGAAVFKYWGYFLAALILTQFIAVLSADNERVFASGFNWDMQGPQSMLVTPPFELKGGSANVLLEVGAELQNNWLEVDMELVNDQTGVSYPVEQGVEYYSGRDADGYSWAEGDRRSEVLLSSVPGGTYHLNVQAKGPTMRDAWGTKPVAEQHFGVTVTRDVTTWADFLAALLLVSVLPLILIWRNHSFEVSRWSTSDFSPYWKEEA